MNSDHIGWLVRHKFIVFVETSPHQVVDIMGSLAVGYVKKAGDMYSLSMTDKPFNCFCESVDPS